jgi:hypothetical protein
MEGSRFDSWTRRRFGLATGSAAMAGLLALVGAVETEAKQNNNNNNNRRRKKKCRKLGQFCDENRRNQSCCNANQLCANVPGLGSGTFCCKHNGQGCSVNNDCCGKNICDSSGRCHV